MRPLSLAALLAHCAVLLPIITIAADSTDKPFKFSDSSSPGDSPPAADSLLHVIYYPLANQDDDEAAALSTSDMDQLSRLYKAANESAEASDFVAMADFYAYKVPAPRNYELASTWCDLAADAQAISAIHSINTTARVSRIFVATPVSVDAQSDYQIAAPT